jgi:hypothetical protein
MIHRRGRRAAALSILVFLALAWPAFAHGPSHRPYALDAAAVIAADGGSPSPTGEPSGETSIRADAVPMAVPAPVAGLAVLLALLVAVRRSRRVVAIGGVAALVALAFEGGLHSVHHLGDERSASQCSVASAAPHLDGAPAEPPAFSALALLPGDHRVAAHRPAPSSQPFRPDAGRAPPPSHPSA